MHWPRYLGCGQAPRRAGAVLALLALAACPETSETPPGPPRGPAEGAPPGATSAPAASASAAHTALPPTEVALVNGQRFAVQLYATQDEAEARARLKAIEAVGLRAALMAADLGPRGIWHRLLVGSFSRRDLAELAGAGLEADQRVRKLLPEPAPGEPFFIVQDAPAAELAPRVAAALQQLVPGGEVRVAIARDQAGQPSGALLAAAGDARVRFIDASGALGAPLPQPRYPGCRACLTLAAAGRVQGVALLVVDDLTGDAASEALLAYRYGEGRAVASLVALGPAAGAHARELGGFVLESSEANAQEAARFTFVDVDGDDDAEILVERLRAVTHEGDLCEVMRTPTIYDIDSEQLRPMDEGFFAALGATAASGGQQSYSTFAAAVQARGDADLLVPAAVSYLSQAGATGDAAARKGFFTWLDGLQGPDAAHQRVNALSRLAAARPEYRAALAGKLDRALAALLEQPATAASPEGCDEAPLARVGRWSATADALEQQAEKSRARADLRALPDAVFSSLASAYPPGSPIASKLDALVDRLAPASARHAAVLRLVLSARAVHGR